MKKTVIWIVFVLIALCSCSVSEVNKDNFSYGYKSFTLNDTTYKIEASSIVREDKNGVSVLVTEQASIKDILYYNDTIYYRIENYGFDTQTFVYAVNMNGEEKRLIFEITYSDFRTWNITDGKMYIQFALDLFEVDLQTCESGLLNSDIYKFQVYNDCLYYREHAGRTFTIYEQNLETDRISTVIGKNEPEPTEELYSNFLIAPDGTFYITRRSPNEIISYKNGEISVIDSGEKIEDEFSLIYGNECVYYIKITDEEYKLYCYNCISNEVREIGILEDYKKGLYVDENYYYYSTEYLTTSESIMKISIK